MKNNLKYYFQARLMPALVTSIPLWILVNQLSNFLSFDFFEMGRAFPLYVKVMFFNSFLFSLAQLNRYISIKFQELIFGEEINKSVVEFAMWGNKKVLTQMTRDIHEKLSVDFGIKALSKKAQHKNKKRARRILLHGVIRVSSKMPDCRVLTRYGLEYVTVRNFIGGCISACVMLLSLFVFALVNNEHRLLWESLVLLVIHLAPVVFSKSILRWFGFRYARKFWERYVYGKRIETTRIGEKEK